MNHNITATNLAINQNLSQPFPSSERPYAPRCLLTVSRNRNYTDLRSLLQHGVVSPAVVSTRRHLTKQRVLIELLRLSERGMAGRDDVWYGTRNFTEASCCKSKLNIHAVVPTITWHCIPLYGLSLSMHIVFPNPFIVHNELLLLIILDAFSNHLVCALHIRFRTLFLAVPNCFVRCLQFQPPLRKHLPFVFVLFTLFCGAFQLPQKNRQLSHSRITCFRGCEGHANSPRRRGRGVLFFVYFFSIGVMFHEGLRGSRQDEVAHESNVTVADINAGFPCVNFIRGVGEIRFC
ncbi:hypothetical protein CEXT_18651 [Caerostris extrusa]|uniref:Uncharacterized protein n=1 Tax=Caerostris extrusa TaxID=172846 RepID=A0AAV4Q4B1_CAEEX|nr:hypothetical protein CEXT_18651 [Caerostris extrusa]